MSDSIVAQLLDMGFDHVMVTLAIAKHGSDLNQCVEYLFRTSPEMPELHVDDGPPPLIEDDSGRAFRPRDPILPPPRTEGGFHIGERMSWQNETPTAEEWDSFDPIASDDNQSWSNVNETSSKYFDSQRNGRNMIDLTNDSDDIDTTPTRQPLRLTNNSWDGKTTNVEEAIASSVNTHVNTEEAQIQIALQESLVTSRGGGLIDPSRFDAIDSLRSPDDRVRQENQPVILRSANPALASVAAYFQALYAVPFYRKKVLEFEPTELTLTGKQRSYDGYWKDESTSQIPKEASDYKLILAVQRLFVFLASSRRSFCHIREIIEVFKLRESEFDRFSTPEKIKVIHGGLLQALILGAKHLVARQLAELEINEREAHEQYFAIAQEYYIFGRRLDYDEYFLTPLPPMNDAEKTAGAPIFPLRVISDLVQPMTFHDAIANSLGLNQEVLNLFSHLPPVFSVLIERAPSDATNQFQLRRSLFRIEPELYLDRYIISKRKEFQEARELRTVLAEQLRVNRVERAKITTSPSGGNGLDLVKRSIEFFEQVVSEDEVRQANQRKLAERYRAILKRMEDRVSALDEEAAALQVAFDAPFEVPEMKEYGPYQLKSCVWRSGLAGRDSNWAYTRGDNGTWWKSLGLENTEVTLTSVLNDTSGLWQDAGAYVLFYELVKSSEIDSLPSIPPALEYAVQLDNLNFANEIPIASAEWNLPPLDLNYHNALTEDPPIYQPPNPYYLNYGNAPPLHLQMPADVVMAPSTAFRYSNPGAKTLTDIDGMTTDVDEYLVESALDDDELVEDVHLDEITQPMRLRGGGPESDDEDDEDENEDGLDEDEVELGCVRTMSSDWNVDLSVGKVGGLPKWIDPTSPLLTSELVCGVCERTMVLLLQMNSPDDDHAHAASRTLYVFACRGKDCLAKDSTRSLRVFRIQMASPNDFYPHSDSAATKRIQAESLLDPTTQLGISENVSSSISRSFPEWELYCESEPYEESYLDPGADDIKPELDDTEDAAEKDTDTSVDKAFLNFQDRISRLPEQILRFYRLPGVPNPTPLWISETKIDSTSIAPCELCGSPRAIEFQILSTLLTHLDDYDFEFDTLLIYSCTENCMIPPREGTSLTGWKEEVILVQSFGKGGAKLGRR